MKKINALLTLSSLAIIANCAVGCNKQQEFSVSFDTTDCTNTFETQKIKKGEKATNPGNPTPKDDKKKCDGWLYNDSPFDFNTPIEKDITLKPNFVDVTFTVTFDTTGCKETYQAQTVKKGEKATNPGTPTPIDSTKKFIGWKNKNVVFSFDTPINEDITLKPIFDGMTFTVTFNTDGFKESYPAQTIKKGEKAKNPGLPKSEDESLNTYGWKLGDTYFDFDNTPIDKDITLTPATTSCWMNISVTNNNQNIDIESTAKSIQFTAKIETTDVTPEKWYSYNGVVEVDSDGKITIPADCKGGVDYIIAKYEYGGFDYYGALKISVASFNKLKLDSSAHTAACSNVNIEGKVIIPQFYFKDGKEIEINNIAINGFTDCTIMTELISLNGITSIPDGAFKNCNNLKTVNLGENIESIGLESFRNCYNLQNVTIPAKVSSIGINAFTGCALESATFINPEGWIYHNGGSYPVSIDLLRDSKYAGYLLSYYFNDATWTRNADVERPLLNLNEITLELNDSYTTTAQLFSNQDVNYKTEQTHCIKVDEYGTVTPLSIGTGYATVQVSNGKSTLSSLCSVHLTDKKYIELHTDDKIMLSINARENATHITLPQKYRKDATSEIEVKGITARGFQETQVLEYIYIPENIETIGEEAFQNGSIKSVVFSTESKCTTIDNGCFKKCVNLTNVNLPRNLTSLGANAFEGCTTLQSVTIGDQLTEIKAETFKNCKKLKGMYIPAKVKSLGKNVFDGASMLSLLYYGGTKDAFKEACKDGLGYTYSLKVVHCIDGDLTL